MTENAGIGYSWSFVRLMHISIKVTVDAASVLD